MENSNLDDEVVIPVEYFSLTTRDLKLSVDFKERQAFSKYSEARQSFGVIKFLAVFSIPLVVYVFIMSLLHPKTWYFIAAIAIGAIAFRNPMAIFTWYIKGLMIQGIRTPFVVTYAPWLPFLQNMVSIISSFTLGLFLIARILNGDCKSLDQYHRYSCNSEYASHALPQEHMLCLMFLPIALSTVFKTIKTPFIAASWIVSVCCIVIAIGISASYQSIPALVIYLPISIAILYENHRENIILYLALRKQQILLNEIRILSEEAQNELRFMIANMAHDLKTPLSSFMNGVELLASLFGELEKTNHEDRKLRNLINDNIKNLFNVNNFMTMTVNRCIDYMKASKGIKLEPRLETINLQEVLSMPLNCMRDLQSRIAIIQKPIPSSVCSHIITDLQWFQENLFCLTSNAVKYSSHGHVSIGLSLVDGYDSRLQAALERKKDFSGHSGSGSSLDGYPLGTPTAGASNDYSFLDKLPTAGATSSGKPKVHPFLTSEARQGSFLSVTSRSDVYVDLEKGADGVTVAQQSGGSVKRIPPNSMSGITINELEAQKYLLIEVEDTGIGLSDEVKNSLFKPFKQAQRRAGGTGLGLYSLAKRVDALGGYYCVSNRRDGEQGSIFWFAVPYRPDEVMARMEVARLSDKFSSRSVQHMSITSSSSVDSGSPLPQSRKASPTSTTFVPRGVSFPAESSSTAIDSVQPPTSLVAQAISCESEKLRILLVDDSVTILKMTSNLLKRHGHVVDQEENGADALKALERSRSSGVKYDIVLLDLNMPVMDGLEAMKRLRETERQLNAVGDGSVVHHQKVFAFTANSDNESMMEALEAGADDFISKPFSIQTFNEKYEKLSGTVS